MEIEYTKTEVSKTECKVIVEDINNCFFTHRNNYGAYEEYFGQFQPDKEKKRVYTIIIVKGGGSFTNYIKVNRTDVHNQGLRLNIKNFLEESNNFLFEQISREKFMEVLEDVTSFNE